MMMMMPQIISSITDYQRRPCHQGLSSHSLQGKRPTKPEHFRPWRRKGICANLFLFSRPKTNTGRAHSKSILNHISHMCYERKKLESKIHVKLIWTEKNVRPNICYIFEKLRVQGCQIWHSHVSIPFNSAPAHSTRPHNAKKALYVIILGEIPEN